MHISKHVKKLTTFLRRQPVLLFIVFITIAIELVLLASDWGLLASKRLRLYSLGFGAFWIGLLDNWRPNFSAQPATMFITYAFLHAGPGHLIGNLLTLSIFTGPVADRMTQKRFALLLFISAIGGAIGFAALTSRFDPMVGTSGAIFGVLGAWYFYFVQAERRDGRGWYRASIVLFLIILSNIVMYYWTEKTLAWETHLGGFIFGLAVALFYSFKNHRVQEDES